MKNKKLEEAQQALADALKEKPELIPYQREIDRCLSKAMAPEMRMTILQFTIAGRFTALNKELSKLPAAIRTLVKERRDGIDDNKGS